MSNAKIIDAPDEGSIEAVNVPMLLAQAWRQERSGLLQLAQGKFERRLEIRKGSPVAIDCSKIEDSFARFLEDTGQITTANRLAVEGLASQRECPQASAVHALKLLEPKALYQAMRSETRNRIAETFEWQAGFYRWSNALPPENPNLKPHDILALLQEQLPRRWGTDRLFGSILSVQDVCAEISPLYRKIGSKLAAAGTLAGRAIARLDGITPLGRVLGECAGDPLAAATLWTLLHAGVLRTTAGKSKQSMEPASLDFDFQVEIEVVEEPNSALDAGAANAAAEAAKGDAKAIAVREQIESLLGQLKTLDHYGALGLESNAGPADFKKAYFKAAKRFHPDTLARMGLDDLREPAAKVFARIADAYETLSDRDKKAAYDSSGSQEPEIDTARLAQAETSFRKGEILSKMGNFDAALEYLEPAVELWPEEPAYQAGLGWALYKQPTADLERAAHHLEIALRQSPKDATIHLRLGLVMRASGDTIYANELVSKARAIDPKVQE